MGWGQATKFFYLGPLRNLVVLTLPVAGLGRPDPADGTVLGEGTLGGLQVACVELTNNSPSVLNALYPNGQVTGPALNANEVFERIAGGTPTMDPAYLATSRILQDPLCFWNNGENRVHFMAREGSPAFLPPPRDVPRAWDVNQLKRQPPASPAFTHSGSNGPGFFAYMVGGDVVFHTHQQPPPLSLCLNSLVLFG